MTETEILDQLRKIAADDAAGWVMLPPPHGAIDLQLKAKSILAHPWRSQGRADEWRSDASRFLAAVSWAGSTAWAATEPDLHEIIERRRLESKVSPKQESK